MFDKKYNDDEFTGEQINKAGKRMIVEAIFIGVLAGMAIFSLHSYFYQN